MADISREDALALLAEQNINQIIKGATAGSAALSSFRTIHMTKGTARMPVLSALPTAGFVAESSSSSTGVKPTSKVEWENKDLISEEIAVIIPIHENVLEDTEFDIWGEIRPLVEQEFGRVLDAAVFFGVNNPTTWDTPIVTAATTAGNTVTEGTGVDLAEDFNELFGLVEGDGFDVSGVFTGKFLRKDLRGLRDADNRPIYVSALRSDGTTNSIYGEDLFFVQNGAWDKTKAIAIAGDTSKAIIGVRSDVQVKLLDQATLGTGESQINLAERDMVALRFKFRVAFAVATPAMPEQSETPYPFAVIVPAAGA